MSYELTLDCGCVILVSCDPRTPTAAQKRILAARGATCVVTKHRVGLRVFLWDLLPDRGTSPTDLDWTGCA